MDGLDVIRPGELAAVTDALRSSPPFDALSPVQLSRVASAAGRQRFEAGTEILRQGGDPSSGLYVIASGSAEVWDAHQLRDEPSAGEVFGELSLLSGAGPTATVLAGKEDLVCLVVEGEVAREVLGTAGGVAFVQSSLRRGVLQSVDRDTRSLADSIEAAADDAEAIEKASELPALTSSLVDDGADAVKVGRVIGTSIDALTRRLLASALADLGEPPAPWAWLALGSEARLEQALRTDQDHALAFDPGERPPEELDPWFADLAERVTAGLETAGIPRCDGDAMAITPRLRRPVDSWVEAFRGWMADAGPEGSLFSSVVFDHRVLDGPLDVQPSIEDLIAEAPARYPNFIRHLGHRALDRKPPTGFVRGLVVESKGEHAGRLDIKHGGVAIITNLARYYAILTRSAETSTVSRLRAASDAGAIEESSREDLEEAFRLLWQIRLEHQVRQVRAGEPADDFVDPAHLGSIHRLGLKEAFRIIGNEQQQLATTIGARY
jgi:signal-transduction protein with cAMP-binding, CBS, and nucleotidyltransferase domain